MGRTRESFARQAEANLGSTAWSKDRPAVQRGNGKRFGVGDWKCNLFVHDMIYDAGVDSPPRTPGGWPATAAMWKNGTIPGFRRLENGGGNSQQRGDIISDGEHCGIAVDSSNTISALRLEVVKDGRLYGGTIQRYIE